MCYQQRLRPACALAQTDQSHCFMQSLEYSMTVKLLTEQHLEFPSLPGGCTGASESTHVETTHCWKSHVTAHVVSFQTSKQFVICYRALIPDKKQTSLTGHEVARTLMLPNLLSGELTAIMLFSFRL